MNWKVFKKGVFFDLPTEHGSIRIYDGQLCVAIIPIQGPEPADVDTAKSLATDLLDTVQKVSTAPALTDIELELVKGGKTLSAVRAYWERTGVSLYDAKKMVDKAIIEWGDSQ